MPEFKEFIRTIGRGQRAGRALTQDEAYQAMSMLIKNQVTPEQKGAFLMLLRVREETPEELAGFVKAIREHSQPELAGLNVDLDMGCYAGKRRILPWFLLSALCLAQTGKRIFLHGTHEPDSNRLYLNEVLPSFGLPVCTGIEQIQQQLDSTGLAYADLADINQPLHELIQLRSIFGLRSCANTLARILNPSNAQASLQGVFHREVDTKHRQCASLLNEANMLCFRGEGGEIEYNPERDVTLHISRQGQESTIAVAAMTASRAIKAKWLDANELVKVWSGQVVDEYADMAVTGTLAIMLTLLDKLDWSEAVQKSNALWQTRHLHEFETRPTNVNQATSFLTEKANSPH